VKTFVPVKHCSRGTLALNLTHYQRRLDVWKIPADRRHAQALAADTPSLIIANKMKKDRRTHVFVYFCGMPGIVYNWVTNSSKYAHELFYLRA